MTLIKVSYRLVQRVNTNEGSIPTIQAQILRWKFLSVHILDKNSISYMRASQLVTRFPFPLDRDGHDFHTLVQYMFKTRVQRCTLMESLFNKILNVKQG